MFCDFISGKIRLKKYVCITSFKCMHSTHVLEMTKHADQYTVCEHTQYTYLSGALGYHMRKVSLNKEG